MAGLEKLHSEALAAKEAEISDRINKAVVGTNYYNLTPQHKQINQIKNNDFKIWI